MCSGRAGAGPKLSGPASLRRTKRPLHCQRISLCSREKLSRYRRLWPSDKDPSNRGTMLKFLASLSVVTLWISSIGLAQSKPLSEFIFEPGSTSFPESHASTIVALKNGELMAAWFGGTKERAPDVASWASRRVNGKWTAPVELEREKNVPTWNPVLFHTMDGTLWLYYKVGPSPGEWSAGRIFSKDEGKTWSKDERLPAGLLGPIRAKPLVLDDGTIVSGSSVEAHETWAAWVERSTDNGKTWAKIGPITISRATDAAEPPAPDPPAGAPGWAADKGPRKYVGIIQPSIVSLGGKHLRLYARSRTMASKVAVADSTDNGVTWTQARFRSEEHTSELQSR